MGRHQGSRHHLEGRITGVKDRHCQLRAQLVKSCSRGYDGHVLT